MEGKLAVTINRRPIIIAVTVLCLVLLSSAAFATIAGTKHDFSTATSSEICVFCHTPHNSNPAGPLWNRAITEQTITMYSSPTIDAAQDSTLNMASLLCMSCHDGVNSTVSYGGNAVSTKHDLLVYNGQSPDVSSNPNCRNCHGDFYGDPAASWKRGVAGTDLRNDHPISILYPTALEDLEFNVPPNLLDGWVGGPKLYNGKIECGTCHEVHSTAIIPFLRMSNNGSALCLTCHLK